MTSSLIGSKHGREGSFPSKLHAIEVVTIFNPGELGKALSWFYPFPKALFIQSSPYPIPCSPCCWNCCDCYHLKQPGKLHLFTTTSFLTSWGRFQNSQPGGGSIFNISFKCWSKENDDNFKALLGGNDLRGMVGVWRSQIRRLLQAQWLRKSVERAASVFPISTRAWVWEFTNVCLGLSIMNLFTPLIKQTSVWLRAGWPSIDKKWIYFDIRRENIMPLSGLPGK